MLCNCEETKALWGPLIRFGEGRDLCNWTNMELKAKSRRLVHGSLSSAELKQTPPIINNTPSFAWEPGQHTGLNAQHVAGIDPPGTICSCMNTFQKPPNSIPHNQGWILGERPIRPVVIHVWWVVLILKGGLTFLTLRGGGWGSAWQGSAENVLWSCGKPAQAFQKQLVPLSPQPSARSTSWA